MNILLTSAGRRGYMVTFFKSALKDSKIYASNSNIYAPAFYYADEYVQTPFIHDISYIPFLINYCKENRIHIVIPLFDIDLPVLSKNKELFKSNGINVIVSNPDVINICNDKWETYHYLESINLICPKTYVSEEECYTAIDNARLNFPLIVKPRWGMGSLSVYKAENKDELSVFYSKVKKEIGNNYLRHESAQDIEHCVLIQELIDGEEFHLDIINDLDGNYQNTVVKHKIAMRSGETDCAEIVNEPKMKEIGFILSQNLRHCANLDVDIIVRNNFCYILEMNARFGGGYPFSHLAGVNLPSAIIKWSQGKKVDKQELYEHIGMIFHKDINLINITKFKYSVKKINTYKEIYNAFLSLSNSTYKASVLRDNNFKDYAQKLSSHAYVYGIIDNENNVFKNGKEVLGIIAFYANDNETRCAYISILVIDNKYQRIGFGNKLIQLTKDIAKLNNMETISVDVHKDNIDAISFYNKVGFHESGKTKGDYICLNMQLNNSGISNVA
jgi:carbamoyl-phosphate synthase large subunit